MTSLAIILLSISALLHATWNFMGKRHAPSAAFFLIALTSSSLCLSPILLIYAPSLPQIPPEVWLLVVAAGFFEALYFISLAKAYARGELSFVYPLVRAVPVLLVLFLSFLLGRAAAISAVAMVGMVLVAVGCLLLPIRLGQLTARNYFSAAAGMALLAALGTTGYTITDDLALRSLREADFAPTHSSLLYLSLQTLSSWVFVGLFTLALGRERTRLRQVLQSAVIWRWAVMAGLVMSAGYGLVLLSMAFVRDVSYVAAFRQLSIPLGVMLGIIIMKEPTYFFKLLGIVAICGGLLIVALY